MNSSVLKWPNRQVVEQSVRDWSARQVKERSDILRLGYYGSYARGDWGVGSDLDLIAIVDETAEPFERRLLQWDLVGLPVQAEIVVYTLPEWKKLQQEDTKFYRMLDREVVWTFSKPSEWGFSA